MVITPGYEHLFQEEIRALGAVIKDSIVDSSLVDNTRRARCQEWIIASSAKPACAATFVTYPELGESVPGSPRLHHWRRAFARQERRSPGRSDEKGIVFCVDVAGRGLVKYGQDLRCLCALKASISLI